MGFEPTPLLYMVDRQVNPLTMLSGKPTPGRRLLGP